MYIYYAPIWPRYSLSIVSLSHVVFLMAWSRFKFPQYKASPNKIVCPRVKVVHIVNKFSF